MKILLRKPNGSLLQGMYVVWVPKALRPEAGGDDPLEQQKGNVLGFCKGEEVWEESLQRGLMAYFLLAVNLETPLPGTCAI